MGIVEKPAYVMANILNVNSVYAKLKEFGAILNMQ